MSRKLALFIVMLMLGALAGSGVRPAAAAPAPQSGPQTFTVLVGGQTTPEQKAPDEMPAGAWQLMRFYPSHLTVNVGDTIVWKVNSAEDHQVDFPGGGKTFEEYTIVQPQPNGPPNIVVNPLVQFPQGGNSYDGSAFTGSGDLGMMPPGAPEYRLTFTKAGSYDYYCSIHSGQLPNGQIVGMTGNITVQAAGSAYPATPDQVSADAQTAIAADQQAALALTSQATQVKAAERRADGTMLYHGNIGFDSQFASYMRFAPENFTVHVGDSIEWTQTSANTPHTVTLTSGAKEPDVALVQPQPNGPPTILLNPVVLNPAGGPTYAGTGYFNSGFIQGARTGAPGPQSYTLTFTQPGTYEYTCVLHDMMGMSGHITVLAAAPGMPTTGQPSPAWVALLLVAIVLTANGVLLVRRARKA